MIYSLEDKTQKELVEICKIQIEEYQILTKRIVELEKRLSKHNKQSRKQDETGMQTGLF